MQQLTLELSQAEDRERKRLAEFLHDDLQQQLAGTKFHLSLLVRRLNHDVETHGMATDIEGMLKEAIEKARTLSHELSPAVLYERNLSKTFNWLANEIRAKHGLVVQVIGDQVSLRSDPLKPFLYRAGQEFLFNVVKHTKVREARLRLRRIGRHVCLLVSDRGQGFTPETLSAMDGFGLLSIRERVKLLGGRMKIRSTPGAGSRFTIVIPDEPAPDTAVPTMPPPEHTGPRAPRRTKRRVGALVCAFRVVVADDHQIVREGLVALLAEESDMELVGEASNGREAIDLACRLRPDVVIMDVAMPLVGGSEATRQIKARVPDTRIIALSMSPEYDMAQEMYEAGAEAYLLKTDPSEKLLAAIRQRAMVDGATGEGTP